MKTYFTLLLMLVILAGILLAFPPHKPESKGFVVAGTDLFWETFDAEFNTCPDEATAAGMLRQRGYEVYE